MLEIRDLHVEIGQMKLVNGVSMTVEDGEIVSLIGANGAGKTTVAQAVSKIHAIRSGQVIFDGTDITAFAPDQVVDMGLIQVPEGRELFSRMTVKENLEIGAYSKRARGHFARNLEYVYALFPELVRFSAKAAGNLSGGQQQMVAIGRGIMADPKLLILDEPSIGLSPLMTQNVLKAVRDINEKGVSLLIMEQNVQAVLSMAKRAYVMQHGDIVLSGTAEEILNNDAVKRAYLGM